jgi:hypothetical protein
MSSTYEQLAAIRTRKRLYHYYKPKRFTKSVGRKLRK